MRKVFEYEELKTIDVKESPLGRFIKVEIKNEKN
jgi:hypothetical protein